MAIVKKNDVMPERPIIVTIYGQAGAGKTSVATTAESPLLIDTDRGYDRAAQRCDTLVASNWEDIIAEKDAMREYKTVVIDTAKACLEDYLVAFAIKNNYKLANNSLKRFGQIAEDFKAFVAELRSYGVNIIFICHDREQNEGDMIKHSPDCTGQSKDLLLRISDQVGYISIINKERTISFEPTDNYVGKNVGQIPLTTIPDASSPEFPTFMADIIQRVKESIMNKSEAQRKANEMVKHLREELAKADTEKAIAAIFKECADLPQILKAPFFSEMIKTLEPKGFVFDKDAKKFVAKKAEAKAEKK